MIHLVMRRFHLRLMISFNICGMDLYKPLAATALGLLMLTTTAQPSTTRALRFGHLWDGTRLLDNATVLVSDKRSSP